MLKQLVISLIAYGVLTTPALASSRRSPEGAKADQSPNNASIVVLVTDQTGAVVTEATVSVRNDQTGAVREAMSSAAGSASFPALPLTGTYSVSVTKPGFGDESRHKI